ncbi:PTS transporter subunit EIIC [Demequina zhanjiangensis]|uniref:PTS transporter subunit EIIC n=1 Tax=Demequina zhanjiangensis TaxID=3051659 RepID=A0ABT8FXZ5_9MICO|nr:PTS transporter subunit EIIC [Demequina sp. SYSU T00b26]MDN4471773.1 PTS transporter subunit EIIC [Demequina sp. SYSU T00b26]
MMYEKFAHEAVAAVGGPDNIRGVTHCATRLRFQLHDTSIVDKARIEALDEAIGIRQSGSQIQIVVGTDVPQAHAAVEALYDLEGGGGAASAAPGEDGATGTNPASAAKGSIFDRILGTISAIFTPYIPLLATVGILKGAIDLAVNFEWMSAESNTYMILQAPWSAMLYFFPILLAFTGAKQFGANPYIGALIGASLVEPGLVGVAQSGANLDFFGIPFVAQSFGGTVIPIILGMWAFGYLERWLKSVMPKITHLLLVPLVSVLVMVPLMLLVFGPLGFGIANLIAEGYEWLVGYPILLSAVFGALFIYVIMIGAHWVVIPIQLGILAEQGYEYSLAAGGMGNYALLGVVLAVMMLSRDKQMRQVAGSAAFVNALSGITEPGLYGVVLKNKRYFAALTLGGLAGGLVCGFTGTYITSFAFTGLFGLPAFASSPTAASYFVAVAVAIAVGFAVTALIERGRRRPAADPTEKETVSA